MTSKRGPNRDNSYFDPAQLLTEHLFPHSEIPAPSVMILRELGHLGDN